jgi:SAM-dependent methyltransferase
MLVSAPACERNREPIGNLLSEIFLRPGRVLEIGSGTGQHAAWFSRALPHLEWQPSDRGDLQAIEAWRRAEGGENCRPALSLDLFQDPWPVDRAEYVVCVNTLHIAPWPATARLMAGAARILSPGGLLFAYGPYRYRDRPLEPSNAQFDIWLKDRDPASGIRLFEEVDALAAENGLTLVDDRPMPANNRAIWWLK